MCTFLHSTFGGLMGYSSVTLIVNEIMAPCQYYSSGFISTSKYIISFGSGNLIFIEGGNESLNSF